MAFSPPAFFCSLIRYRNRFFTPPQFDASVLVGEQAISVVNVPTGTPSRVQVSVTTVLLSSVYRQIPRYCPDIPGTQDQAPTSGKK